MTTYWFRVILLLDFHHLHMKKNTKQISYKAIIWKEDKHYVAQCLNLDISSFGDSKDEAKSNLKEAIELYFENSDISNFLEVDQAEIVTDSVTHA